MLDHRGESMEFISTLDMVYSYRVALDVLLKTDSYVERELPVVLQVLEYSSSYSLLEYSVQALRTTYQS